MTIKHVAFDGKSNFFLDQYPESAWVQLSPTTSDMADSRSGTQAATNYYQSVAFLFRCVQIRQAALLNVPWAVTRNEKDIWTSEESKPPADLAFMANFRRLLRNTEAALCLAPEAFWFRERNRARTLSLKWHAPSSVMPQWSESEGLTGFKRILGGGKERTFEPNDYIYFALPNPMHETIPGRPPAQAAMASAGVLYNVDAFASAFFSRGAIKATLLTVEGNPQNSEMLKLEAWWKRFFSGVKSAWETAAVRAGVKPVVIGEGMESLNQSTLTRERKEDIATALGIPHSIVMSDAANRSVAETDDLHFYDKTIIPEMEFLAETLNDQLFGPLGYEFVLRPQSMTVFQANEEDRSMSLLHYTQAGFPAHVAAEILGIDLPHGMEYAELAELISGQQAQRDAVAMSAMQARQAQTPPATETATEPGPEPAAGNMRSVSLGQRTEEIRRFKTWAKKRNNPDPSKFRSDILSEEEKRAILANEVSSDADFFTIALPSVWSGQNIPSAADSVAAWKAVLQLDEDDDEAEQRARDAIERAAADNLERALQKQRREVQRIARNLNPDSMVRWMSEDLEQAFTRSREEYDLYDMLRRALLQAVDLGISVAVSQFDTIGFGFDWTLANDNARRWAEQYSGELVRNINATSLERTRRAVSAWIDNGESLAALIEDLAPIFGRQRAELIASTEVTRAYARGNRESYLEAGVTRWEWRTAVDERVCRVCGPLHNQTIRIDENFDELLSDEARQFVRQSFASPPAHPRCRCWIVPVIDD
jgi:SPP1 gp7 family putative phage head morphogenesis protein